MSGRAWLGPACARGEQNRREGDRTSKRGRPREGLECRYSHCELADWTALVPKTLPPFIVL